MLQDLVLEHPVLAARLREVEEGFDVDFYRDEVPSALERLTEGLDRVSDILNAMRELAPRPEDEAQEISDLNRAIANTLTLAKGTVRQHGRMVLDLAVLPPVRCRADKLSSVLLNLLINAGHALEDRYGTEAAEHGIVNVHTRVQGTQILLEVTDNGGGISVEDGEKIFDPFFTTKEVGRGTGQGLAIARAVVQSHGGQISFESRPGVGTTFRISVPINGPTELRAAS
jgi:signal transduction histidine kinase